ncbi:hypothetical protein CGLO_07406 [Colletotrichum gloeosporioides Cg-14]|uniref:Uncharacterized protein n=1 Tax=Colletotrichum gloeosporioides (strain Cg-14) TaxID=1237896 RepID=T0LMM5_COLGC|nr:hypothetical protein CGLO_07406 [Colletotrichum gloeosporioides Cg-14]
MPPANHNINPLVTTGILRSAIPNTAITTASSIGSNAVRDSSYYVQADRWPTPRPAEAQSKDDVLSDPTAHSAPPFIVVRVSRSPAAAELSGTILTSSSSGKKTHEGSKENEKQAVPSTRTRPTTMAERKPYDGGGIVPPHIRTAIAESKNTSAEAAPAKTPETNPAGKEIRAEEFTRSGFVPAYVLKNIATSEASTAEQRADAQGTLDLDTARRERGKDAEGQVEK